MSGSPPFWDRVGPQVGWVHKQLRRLGVREADLEDVCQDLLLTVFRTWEHYDSERPIRPWLFGFAFRITGDYRKRASYRRPTLPLDVEPESPVAGPDAGAEQAQARRIAIVALQEVDELRRAVLVLADFEDVATADIASALDIPLNTVYSRLRVARAEFGAAVQKLLERAAPAGRSYPGGKSGDR